MSELTTALERLVSGWEHYGIGPSLLSPGTPREEAASLILDQTGLVANDEVLEWFEFSNGPINVRADRETFGLVPDLRVGSLERTFEMHALFLETEMIDRDYPQPLDLNRGYPLDSSYLPLATGSGGTHLAVRLADGPAPGPAVGTASYANWGGDVWISATWPTLASFVNEAAWYYLTDQVPDEWPFGPTSVIPDDSPYLLSEYAERQRPRPIPDVAAFFGD